MVNTESEILPAAISDNDGGVFDTSTMLDKNPDYYLAGTRPSRPFYDNQGWLGVDHYLADDPSFVPDGSLGWTAKETKMSEI